MLGLNNVTNFFWRFGESFIGWLFKLDEDKETAINDIVSKFWESADKTWTWTPIENFNSEKNSQIYTKSFMENEWFKHLDPSRVRSALQYYKKNQSKLKKEDGFDNISKHMENIQVLW